MIEVLNVPVNTGQMDGTTVEEDWEEEPITLVTFKHVDKDDMWVVDNPGSQEILFGSFQPVISTPEEWMADAYANYEKDDSRYDNIWHFT